MGNNKNTKEEFAKLIDGRDYGHETTKRFEKIAKEHDLLICYPDDNDLLIWRGLFDDETANYEGGSAYIVERSPNILGAMCDVTYDDLILAAQYAKIELHLPKIEVLVQHKPEEVSADWRVVPFGVPYANFRVNKIQGGLFCYGVVLDKSDILQALGGRYKINSDILLYTRNTDTKLLALAASFLLSSCEFEDHEQELIIEYCPHGWDESLWVTICNMTYNDRLIIARELLTIGINRI